ncbi:DUF935 domain-containing protein [Neorhizobium petrolearium]|uniref:DUF935 domain-containing protein n=1 Tax=Neorhizobium petrolearium TaxID=515361 RepID=UPI003F7DE0AE
MAKIIDQWGNPVSAAMLKKEQAAPTMMGVRRPNTEHQASGLTPAKLGRLLRTSLQGDPEAYLALAEDMEERDLHYAGVLSSRKLQVAGLEITVDAASDAAADVENADMIRAFIERDAFETELVDILDAIGKGFSATEIIWETSESQWEPVALKWRDPRWFRFADEDGETPLLRDVGGDQPLKPYKWVFHQAKVKSGLPIRGGIARAVCWTFLFKSFTGKDWAIFCEAYGQPLRLGKWGEGASEKDKEVLLQAVANIGVDYSAIVPASMSVEFVKADIAGSHELYEKRSDWLDRQVSKLVLGQTGTTDMSGSSGYAQAKVHDGVKADIERSDARQLAATLNRDFVRPYIDLNKGPQKAYPKIRIGRPEEVDLEKWMKNVQTFVAMGGKVGMSTVRDKIGIEDPGADEELLAPPGRQVAPADIQGEDPPQPSPRSQPRTAAQRAAAPAAPADAIDTAIDDMLADDGWEPMVGPMIEGLEEKLAEATGLDDARRILADHLQQMDVEALADRLARATFAARLAGIGDDELSDEV